MNVVYLLLCCLVVNKLQNNPFILMPNYFNDQVFCYSNSFKHDYFLGETVAQNLETNLYQA